MSVNKVIVIFSVIAFIGATQGLPQESVALMMQLQKICINTSGSDEGYQQYLSSLELAKTCLLNRLDIPQLQSDIQMISQSRKQFFDRYCPQFQESLSCFDESFTGLSKCVSNDTDQMVMIIKEMSSGILDLMCRNEGQMFFDVQKPAFGACMQRVIERSVDCEVSSITSKTPITGFNELQCSKFEDSRKCLKGLTENCEVSGISDVFDVMYRTISKANNCKEFKILNELTSNEVDNKASE